ncbi:hypothetical protein M1843_15425 [Isoptericola sp. 4D.3]|uniref:Uncharacterized protein n=1 Tax=Isoptericola peretonis TaxID=2918523 RepID=A0ABT0J6M4_9MICO|nr:hypothetical protein [Isoptericola sp. 4D.3]
MDIAIAVRGPVDDVARDRGCVWLHVDFEADRAQFYLDACGFRRTAAGLMQLR